MLKVGIVGFGNMGALHLNNYLTNYNCKVIALCDLEDERISGEKFFSENIKTSNITKLNFGSFRKYNDIDAIINDKDIDIIDICLPAYLNAEVAIKAMKAGKHVICEKPMANTLKEAKQMLDTAREEKVILMIAQHVRFQIENIYLKNIIKSERLGKLNSLLLSRIGPIPLYSWENWLLDEKKSGGAILNAHIHDTDFIVSLFGKPQKVFTVGVYSKDTGGFSHIITQYLYPDIPIITSVGGWMMPDSFEWKVSYNAIFEKGVLYYDNHLNPNLIEFTDKKRLTIEHRFIQDGYKGEIDYFIDCVKNNKWPAECSPESTYESLQVVFDEINFVNNLRNES
ncbi:MAG: Gfo/Idh/MocA family oxidoreductase [Actinobacteria bacterium]|nr:Gfo/Idh/MocA family oxidoreductase [Actinomycetota bacterium]